MTTASTHVRRQAAANESLLAFIWRWVKNTLWSVLFGQSEWDRICGPVAGPVDEIVRTVKFRTTLALSKALVSTCNVVFDFEGFDVSVVAKDMIQTAQINDNKLTVVENVRSCLHRGSFVNRVYARVLTLKDEAYDSANTRHEAMLEDLWSNLKPDVRRTGGRITKEWGEIGFQGTDPMSDFRSMGVLSLVQLNYFSAKYPVEAQKALVESNHPTRWYPFSVTGINITHFVVELIRERLLDVKIYRFADVRANDREETVVSGVDGIHEIYCDIFVRFNKFWVGSNPRDVMAFPTIFESLKTSIRQELTTSSFAY
ncbi:hypothetical protein Poli38472_012898 [Pythium oligandrum]|uniref:ELMO domain-containing protein n=1 Tax=Pythium oligandrum TaxID=41045 RepID=A0A8K1FIW4_PYTOL|nr:hypothetical protein Poli38472_012898 [Pythium oligandrum]|eukprot:TMW64276.1 hypothetical protein Poli38472_012898 [Pythium oligandrum]